MYSIGSIAGGALAVTLLGLLVGLAFKSRRPNERALLATLSAWILAGVLAGFGMADGEGFRFGAILIYIPGAIVAFLYLRWRYGKDWIEDEA